MKPHNSGRAPRRILREAAGHVLFATIAGLAFVSILATGTYQIVSQRAGAHSKDAIGQSLSRAISVLATEANTAVDGFPLPPAGDMPFSDGYYVPSTSAADRIDRMGAPLLYCPWDNGQTNSSSGRLAGDAPGADASVAIGVISSGVDKRLETTCANARAGVVVGDDMSRTATVAQMRALGGTKYYLAPVECENAATPTADLAGNAVDCSVSRSRLDLVSTTGLADGALITVRKSGKVFQWVASATQWRQTSGQGGGYTAPDDFSFTSVTGASLGTLIVSNTVTLANVSAATPITIESNGEYQINGGVWTRSVGSVNPGDSLAVRVTSSTSALTTVTTWVNVGGKTRSFSVTTTSPATVEEVFATNLYTGNSSTQTITTGVDLAGHGGMIWIKMRSATSIHAIVDTVRGLASPSALDSSSSGGQFTLNPTGVASVTATGFNLGSHHYVNTSSMFGGQVGPQKYVAWSFRRAEKFFDVVTWTGNGTSNRQISHALGIVPGMIVIKRTDSTSDWFVYHRGNPFSPSEGLALNLTASTANTYQGVNDTPTASVFQVDSSRANISGATYVAYLFAHDTGTDGLIQAGSFTTNASEQSTTTLGWEPQFILMKHASGPTAASQSWRIYDSMRGLHVDGVDDKALYPNNSNAEGSENRIGVNATGFTTSGFGANETIVYLAIRRGPMGQPTSSSQFYSATARTGNGSETTITTGFPVDLCISRDRNAAYGAGWMDRLRGNDKSLMSHTSSAERADYFFSIPGIQDGIYVNGGTPTLNELGVVYSTHCFRRYPSVLDIVNYVGTGAGRTVPHNLGVAPELIFIKARDAGAYWTVYHSGMNYLSPSNPEYGYILLNHTQEFIQEAEGSSRTRFWNDTKPTSTVFSLGAFSSLNGAGGKYIAYLFSSLPGFTKVGRYSGSSGDVTIDAGFAGSPRLVLIKRADLAGNWVLFDQARGITSGGSDPALLLNSSAAEVSGSNYIEPTGSGFIAKAGVSDVNSNGGTYIFLAIK